MDWNNLVYLDLFSGVGGFTHGILNAGVKFKQHYFSEIDKHSIAVYKYHYEKAQEVGNIVSFSGDGIQRPNLITFGFPCQDLSIAGKQRGLAGERSGLFFQALRLIQKFKPEIFIFENVAGLLSSNNGKDFEVVLRAIADLGLYECQWQLVNTRWLLPQNRERVYFVGCLGGAGRARVFPFRKGDKEFYGKRRSGDGVVSASIDSNYWKGADGKRTMICDTAPMVEQKTSGQTVTTKINETGCLQAGGANVMDKVPNVIIDLKTAGGKSATRRGGVKQDESPTLDSNCNLAVSRAPLKFKTRNQKNIEGDYAFTVDSVNTGGVSIGSAIRRLTPVECERLQGFEDGWTALGNYDGIVKPVPNTQRYRQMGNAVTTLWPQLIMQRLMTSL